MKKKLVAINKKPIGTRKKPTGLIITIIILAVLVVALGIILLAKNSVLDKIVKTYQRDYPDAFFSVQMITGDDAKTLAPQIQQYCPDFKLETYYVVSIEETSTQTLLRHVINPVTGKSECIVNLSASAVNANINSSQNSLTQNLLATVNNEPVYMNEVNALYESIPAEQRTNSSMQQAFDQVIGNKLLLQDAAKKGLTVKDENVTNAINTLLTNNKITLEQLQQNLAKSNSTMEIFTAEVKKSLLLQAEVNDITKQLGTPTEEEIRAYYDANKQNLFSFAAASTRQLMVYANDSNKEQKLEYIKSIGTQINSTNFCELVTQYSEDLASVAKCGLYDFQQGQLLPEYEQVVFNSTIGSTKIIQSRIGYHIVQILGLTPSRQLSYEESKQSISNYLSLQAQQKVVEEYIKQLRANAKIVSYTN